MEYYIELYKNIVSMIDSINNDIASIKKDISEYQMEINLFDKEISNRRDDIVYEIECLEDKEKIYNSNTNSLLKFKKNISTSICVILLSSLLLLMYFLSEKVISNICLVSFFAISVPCGLNIIGKYIKSSFIKKTISKFDVSSNRNRINFLKGKLDNIDISLMDIYNDREIIIQKLFDSRTELNEKRIDIKNFEEEKRGLENNILEYIREIAILSCNKDIEGQIFMDDVFKKIRKL